jgi:tryptophanase
MLTDHQILVEGHPTYGGLAGRDLKGLVEGLKTVTNVNYLDYRINQVGRFGSKLIQLLKTDQSKNHEAPVLQPIGGHAVYLKMDDFFSEHKTGAGDFKGISFTALLLIAGHRLVELGDYSFGSFKDGKEIPPDPPNNYVRAAVPRLTYEDQDLFSCAEAIKVLYDDRHKIPGVKVIYGQDLPLRHFKSRFGYKL